MKDIPELKLKQNFLGKVSSWLIDRYRVIYLLIVLIVATGLYSYYDMPKESFPDIEINYIFVTVPYPGASVQDVETLVTEEVENAVDGIENLDGITSTTVAGYAQVVLEFDEDTEMKQAELDVQTAVNALRFPDGVMDPMVIQMESGEIPIMNLTLTGEYDLVEINEYAQDLAAKFEAIDGVKNVDISGGKEREIKVSVDQNALLEHGLTSNSISSALAGSNIQLPLGDKGLDHVNYSLRVDEAFKTIEEIENLVIVSGSSGTIFLKDVATVSDGYKKQNSMAYTYTTEFSEEEKATPVIKMALYRETGADIIGISDTIKTLLKDEKGLSYPKNLSVIITSDESENVAESLDTVLNSALGGLLVVIAVLFIFIGLNESIIVALVIPLSLFISLVTMNLVGITINMTSLVGFVIALGLLVDNAIVVMENIDRLRDEGLDRVSASKVGTNQVAPAVFAATITTVGAFVPLALQKGMMAQFISILPKTLIITILASFVVSIAITPNLSSRLLSKYKKTDIRHTPLKDVISILFVFGLTFVAFLDKWKITPWAVALAIAFSGIMVIKIVLRNRNQHKPVDKKHGYIDNYLAWLTQFLESKLKRWSIFAVALVVLAVSIATIPMGILELELLPTEEPNSATIDITAPEGYLLEDTYEVTGFIEQKLYLMEDLESFDIVVGGNKKNEAKITVNFVESDSRKISGYVLVDELRELVKTIPGAEFDVKPVSDLGPMGAGSDISVGIKGDDLNELNAIGSEYLKLLEQIDGVDHPTISSQDGVKEITIEIDKNRASYYGLNPGSMANDLRQRISGVNVGAYKEAGDAYDITLYFDERPIESVSDFEKVHFQTPMGQLIPFEEVATLEFSEGMARIDHEDGDKVVTVSANVKNGYNATVVGKTFEEVIKAVPLPEGMVQTSGGQMQSTDEQTETMLMSFLVAIFLVYMALVIQFNSFQQPFVILMSVPFALIGIIFGLIVTGNNLGVFAMMGIVALVGIAVNDAIVLVDFANYQRSIGKSVKEATLDAVRVRFLPVIATSLTTMGGVLPLALYNAYFSQLGYAIVFGLLASTVLTLLIIPLLYYMMEDRTVRRESKKQSKKNQEVTVNGL
ncbi:MULTISPECIES: efflux RND transporter permease subunit [unclassified Fusibacter]|uniref:efflux RND transporter permease subunit n=1 Tax=unclassified Fusibacter TaxID=2624464 RepID=UPI001010BF99|nr:MULTISPECIES: efflux RND transporter permease subunit [unclassified Fusibacter]MCK8060178.1 efflux RND transporter permease subunit [Fusibacter sp. A2]NPE22318.1 efflux RND transporter permease subunit [Fusibacter sp. A1]RXV61091.1 AcrB/AcrD/AcrF family protein [Fusibacter sp. A1]